jgi:hypothetical protein
MDEDTKSTKKSYSEMSKLEQDQLIANEFLKRFRQKRLVEFEEKWKNKKLPWGVMGKSAKIGNALINSIHDMWWDAGIRLDKSGWISMGEQIAAIIEPCMKKCYYLGYEMAAGNVQRGDGNDYLLSAVEPIENFAIEITGILVLQGHLNKDAGVNFAKIIVSQAILAGNDHIILGIDNYHKVSRWF